MCCKAHSDDNNDNNGSDKKKPICFPSTIPISIRLTVNSDALWISMAFYWIQKTTCSFFFINFSKILPDQLIFTRPGDQAFYQARSGDQTYFATSEITCRITPWKALIGKKLLFRHNSNGREGVKFSHTKHSECKWRKTMANDILYRTINPYDQSSSLIHLLLRWHRGFSYSSDYGMLTGGSHKW